MSDVYTVVFKQKWDSWPRSNIDYLGRYDNSLTFLSQPAVCICSSHWSIVWLLSIIQCRQAGQLVPSRPNQHAFT